MHTNIVRITDLHLTPLIGVYDAERKTKQDVYVDVTIQHTRETLDDRIETTLDYDTIVNEINAYVHDHAPYLIETLGHAIADLCLQEPTVTHVKVEVKKPNAIKNGLVSVVVSKSR